MCVWLCGFAHLMLLTVHVRAQSWEEREQAVQARAVARLQTTAPRERGPLDK